MDFRRFSIAARSTAPWMNGGGTTRGIVLPPRARAAAWDGIPHGWCARAHDTGAALIMARIDVTASATI